MDGLPSEDKVDLWPLRGLYLDGEWEYPLDSFHMQEFLAWLYNEAPCKDDVVVNDRFGVRLTDIISPNERVQSLA